VLLLLDDLHAADESSLNLLHYLALRSAALRFSVVATCRESAVRAGTSIQMALAHLDSDRLARGLRLPRLAFAASSELMADALADPPPPAVIARICEITDGNPFDLVHVSLAWSEAGRRELPRDAASALRARLARLDPNAGRLLAGGAVIGDVFALDLAAYVAGLSREQSLAGLRAVVQAGFVAADGPHPRFVNTRVRDEVVTEIDPARRAALHRVAAEAREAEVTRRGGEEARPDELAWHWKEAFAPTRAFRYLVTAGHQAAEGSGLAEAIGFHEAALDAIARHGAGGGEERLELLDSIGRARLGLGELESAVDAFRAGADSAGPEGWRPSPDQRARARRLAALALGTAGDLPAAHRELDLGLSDSAAEGEGTSEERAALLALRARLHLHSGRFDLALAAAEWSAAEADRLGQSDLLARANDLAALARSAAGQPAAPPVERAGPSDRRHGDILADAPFDLPLVLWDAAHVGDLATPELLRLAGLERDRCRERGDDAAAAVPLFATGTALLGAGDLGHAEAALTQALARFRTGNSAVGEALALERLGVLHNSRGQTIEAMELLAEGVVVAERAPLRRHLLVRLLVAQARSRLASGSLHAAEVIAREASDCAVRHGVCSVCEAALRPLSVRIALARERLDDAAAEASIFESVAASRGSRMLLAVARTARAGIEAALGQREKAAALLAEARTVFEALGRRHQLAVCARAQARLGAPRDPALEAILSPDAALLD
jgi:tetratricopeptide (TPR) repeat protein